MDSVSLNKMHKWDLNEVHFITYLFHTKQM